jgi:predicted nucleic acid-binding protein
VLAECGNAAARRAYRGRVVQLGDELESAGGMLAVSEPQWRAAWDTYAADRPGGPGLVDQISFAVMRRYGLREAFTNDHHFRAAGFVTLF